MSRRNKCRNIYRNICENIYRLFMTIMAVFMLSGCSNSDASVFDNNRIIESQNASIENTSTEITVFAAKSLSSVIDELIDIYRKSNPEVTILTNYDSSGALLSQITEGGASCDIFFSAAKKQMDILEEANLLVENTREDLFENQMCVVTYPGSNTMVTGITDMDKAASLAIAAVSVPIGRYTRQALINIGIISVESDENNDISDIPSSEISEALGGVEINECANAGMVVASIMEHSNEVGTIYLSDIYGHESELEILEIVPTDISGKIIYPVAQVVNEDADEAEIIQAKKFLDFLKSEEAKTVYKKYLFETEDIF